jgi:hypothetical protein
MAHFFMKLTHLGCMNLQLHMIFTQWVYSRKIGLRDKKKLGQNHVELYSSSQNAWPVGRTPGQDFFIFYFLASKFLRLTTCIASYRSVLEDPGCSEGNISSITVLYEAVRDVKRKEIVAEK